MSTKQAQAYHSITIGEKNTWDDWRLVPTSRPLIPPPGVNTSFIDIPSGDGYLDLTESLTGHPTYKSRSGSWEFLVMNDYMPWETRYSEIMAYLHGRTFRAILDDDPGYYYEGRFSVSEWNSEKNWSKININYVVGPYKIEITGSDEDWLWDTFNFESMIIREYKNIQVSGNKSITVINDIMPVTPIINATPSSGTMYVALDGDFSKTLSSGDNIFRDMKIYEGTHTLYFSGNGTIKIKMHGGRF